MNHIPWILLQYFHIWLKVFNLATGLFERIKQQKNACKRVISKGLFNEDLMKKLLIKNVFLKKIGNDYSLKVKKYLRLCIHFESNKYILKIVLKRFQELVIPIAMESLLYLIHPKLIVNFCTPWNTNSH